MPVEGEARLAAALLGAKRGEAMRGVRLGRLPVNGAVERGLKETSVFTCDSRPRSQTTDVARTGIAVTIDARQPST